MEKTVSGCGGVRRTGDISLSTVKLTWIPHQTSVAIERQYIGRVERFVFWIPFPRFHKTTNGYTKNIIFAWIRALKTAFLSWKSRLLQTFGEVGSIFQQGSPKKAPSQHKGGIPSLFVFYHKLLLFSRQSDFAHSWAPNTNRASQRSHAAGVKDEVFKKNTFRSHCAKEIIRNCL